MKRKYFLRGMGVGILFAAIILCLGYRKQNSEKTVVQRAKELGMVFPERTPDALLVPSGSSLTASTGAAAGRETPTATAKTPDTEPTNRPEPSGTSTARPKPTAEPAKKTKRPETPTDKPDTEKTGSTYTFTVRGGLLSSSVAREMKEAGIIKDADAFDKYVEDSGMARKIRAGRYKIPAGADYEEIVKIITRS